MSEPIVTAEQVIRPAFFIGHTTSYFGPTNSRPWWEWSCTCGEHTHCDDHEGCVRHTRRHWADRLNALLASMVAERERLARLDELSNYGHGSDWHEDETVDDCRTCKRIAELSAATPGAQKEGK